MIRASLGSATRHMALKSTTARTTPTTARPPMMYSDSLLFTLVWSHGGDDDGARGEDSTTSTRVPGAISSSSAL